MAELVSPAIHLDRFLKICTLLPECRSTKNLRYPCGLLVFALLLCECSARLSQRSKEIWLEKNWRWIKKMWIKAGGLKPYEGATPCQSTLSRFLAVFDEATFCRLLCEMQRSHFIEKWELFVKGGKEAMAARKQKQKGLKRKKAKSKKTIMPHYSFDGKARKGCTSETTGRTELDLTLFSSQTNQVLAKRTLNDKQGERNGVLEILEDEARSLPSGVITGDAGILCPKTVSAAIAAGHSYIMQIKGNAGEAFDEIRSLPWGKVKVQHENFNEGHGRREIRMLKKIEAEFVEFNQLEKYENIAVALELETWVHHIKEDKYTKELSYFIADQKVAEIPLSKVTDYIRSHWKQESYHWIKDAILKEDDSMQKRPNGSRTLATLRSYVVFIGKEIFGSVKTFIDHFSADPEGTVKKR